MSLAVNDQTIETIVGRIREETGAEVVLHGSVPGTMLSLRLVDQSVESILNSITTPQNWTWIQRADGSYHIYDQESYVSEVLTQRVQRKVFPLRFIEAAELDGVIAPILTPEIGASSADERTNSLIVTDLPDKLALIESIIREYDVQLYSHVFEILNADTEEIADRLDQIRSEYAEIFVDPINRLIIVRDETLTKIKIMEQLVELLDRDVEIRAYNLNNIGADGGDAEEIIEKFIEPIVTQDAVVEFNLATSKLYVRDVRAVHQKIYDILRQIDVPRKQVLIEGELLSVSQSNEMNISMNWRFGNSLLDAIDTNKIDGFPGVVAGDDRNRQLAGFPYGAVSSEGISLIDMSAHVRAQLQALLSDSRTRLLLSRV